MDSWYRRLSSETVRRFVAANRRKFDCPAPFPGAAERQVTVLEAALVAARAETAELQNRLHAFETSTSWRLTSPIRWLVKTLQRARAIVPPAVEQPLPSAPPSLPYENWVRAAEADGLASLLPGPGRQAIRPQRLGLVILATNDSLVTLDGLECPEGCRILVLEKAGMPPTAIPETGYVLRKSIPSKFAPADTVGLALDHLEADMLCFLDGEDRLAPGALSLAAAVLAQQPHIDMLFADEDWLDADGHRERPFFKPGWNPELQRGRDLVGPFAFFRTALVHKAHVSPGSAWRYDLANQVAAATRPERIWHIPAVLCHRTTSPPDHDEAIRTAAAAQLQRDGVAARVEPIPNQSGCYRVIYDLPRPEPLVSIIVPTRDRADLLRSCADGVLNRTAFPRLELLIVDNDTIEPDALALLNTLSNDPRVIVLRQSGAFNWSALNNAAAAQAAGDVLVLLNNDIAVLQPDWLTVLVSHALQPGIGAVGAKLLYPDGRVQHAGLTTDYTGIPRHLFRYAPGDTFGAFGLLGLAREVWGLTGACLAIPRDVFFAVGGLNEALPVAYNDVDFCLRLTVHGYRLIWTPWSLVEHREMASRLPDHVASRRHQAMEERNRLLRDWGCLALHDPFLNPNLRLVDEQPCLRSEFPAELAGFNDPGSLG